MYSSSCFLGKDIPVGNCCCGSENGTFVFHQPQENQNLFLTAICVCLCTLRYEAKHVSVVFLIHASNAY